MKGRSLDYRSIRSDLLLLPTAAIWGFAFVAQRVGMDHVGPFTFGAIRFALGALVLVPFCVSRLPSVRGVPSPKVRAFDSRNYIVGAGSAGLVLFAGVSLQQIGLVTTTAGNAGFITGLYVVIVPIMGIWLGQRTTLGTWIGASLAALGLYFLSVTQRFTINPGDLYVLAGAFVWAAHVHIIARYASRTDPLWFAAIQFTICAVLSCAVALFVEPIDLAGIHAASLSIFYGGVFSVGVAYTLQVVAQREAHPAHAAVLLSLEAVFAALGGWLILREILSVRAIMGAGLLLAGMLVTQLYGLRFKSGVKRGFRPSLAPSTQAGEVSPREDGQNPGSRLSHTGEKD